MPYKCVHCSQLYEEGDPNLLAGCGDCKSKFFFYIKSEKLLEIERIKLPRDFEINLTAKEKKQIERDVREISGLDSEESPVFLDFESVKVLKPGKYLLDLQKLFSREKPRVYQLEDGKYIVELTTPVL